MNVERTADRVKDVDIYFRAFINQPPAIMEKLACERLAESDSQLDLVLGGPNVPGIPDRVPVSGPPVTPVTPGVCTPGEVYIVTEDDAEPRWGDTGSEALAAVIRVSKHCKRILASDICNANGRICDAGSVVEAGMGIWIPESKPPTQVPASSPVATLPPVIATPQPGPLTGVGAALDDFSAKHRLEPPPQEQLPATVVGILCLSGGLLMVFVGTWFKNH